MKVVYETADYPEALIKKGILEDSGIPVYVDNLHSAGGAMPELGFTVGYRIMVPDVAEAEAIAIVNDIETQPILEDMATVPETGPVSTSIPKSLVRIMAVALVIFFAANIIGNAFAAGISVCTQDKRQTLDCGGLPLSATLGIDGWPL